MKIFPATPVLSYGQQIRLELDPRYDPTCSPELGSLVALLAWASGGATWRRRHWLTRQLGLNLQARRSRYLRDPHFEFVCWWMNAWMRAFTLLVNRIIIRMQISGWFSTAGPGGGVDLSCQSLVEENWKIKRSCPVICVREKCRLRWHAGSDYRHRERRCRLRSAMLVMWYLMRFIMCVTSSGSWILGLTRPGRPRGLY